MNLSHLGTPISPMTHVHGGFANRVYRLDTDQGSFAVKELNLIDRRWKYRVDDVFRFEQAAFAAGISMPEPISASHDTLIHRWVDGHKVPEAPVPAAFAFEIGEILALIHADVEWTHESIEDPTPRDWRELAERAAATKQPWAEELASNVETLLAIAHFVDTCERPGPVVLTHKDIQPWNLLAQVAGGGALPPSGPSWFVFMIGGWLGFTRWNILRCLAGVEASTGPDLKLSHDSVRNGMRGLPDMFRRLPDLQDLLARR